MTLFSILFFLPIGCSYKKEKQQISQHPLERGTLSASALSYDLINSYVFGPSCVSCHGNSGGVNLGSYESVLRHLPGIERTAIHEMTMPPNNPLTPRQREVLMAWIDEGAPFKGSSGPIPPTLPNPTPTPTPTVPPLEASFSSIKTHIFEKKCIVCHSPQGSARGVLLRTKEDLLNSPRELVIPQNYEESGLYISLIREDDKQMPPPDSGFSPLKEEEIEIIKKWIDEGAEK